MVGQYTDTAVWLAGSKDNPGQVQTSIAHQTIEALRGDGLLDDVFMTKEGLVKYPIDLKTEVL